MKASHEIAKLGFACHLSRGYMRNHPVAGRCCTRAVLERRAALLSETVAGLDRDLAGYSGTIPRVTLLETEYLRAVTDAELRWITALIDDLRSGSLTWSEADFAAATDFLPAGLTS